MLIFQRVALSSRILVVMLDEAPFPFVLCVWVGAVMIVSIVLIVLMSLMLLILVSFLTLPLHLFCAFDAASSLYAMFLKALSSMAFQRPGLLL